MEHLLPEDEDEDEDEAPAPDPDPDVCQAPGRGEAQPAGPVLACARRALSLEEAMLV